MSDVSPTRSAVIEMKDERRAMHEGYVFLDEKCLLLAGEILRQLALHARLQQRFAQLHADAVAALQSAVARHGLQGLQVHPPADLAGTLVPITARALMGVRLQAATWQAGDHAAAVNDAVMPSPEAKACQQTFAAAMAIGVELAAVSGNLERLSFEYRRSVRRARALQDVMLPELDHVIGDIEGRLEELEQEDAIWMRQGLKG
ncbi:MAG: V-type ATP synthase subunit D [Aquabacterium sp.]|nr:V-type ATP synthase subunit D [Aquabacterium sp.]